MEEVNKVSVRTIFKRSIIFNIRGVLISISSTVGFFEHQGVKMSCKLAVLAEAHCFVVHPKTNKCIPSNSLATESKYKRLKIKFTSHPQRASEPLNSFTVHDHSLVFKIFYCGPVSVEGVRGRTRRHDVQVDSADEIRE